MTKILCVDFDGVIHSYISGWKGADKIADAPVPGSFDWLEWLIEHGFEVCIYSSRSKEADGVKAMKEWFVLYGFTLIGQLKFPTEKPPAWLTIDDRAICFDGTFPTVEQIDNFKPWYKNQ